MAHRDAEEILPGGHLAETVAAGDTFEIDGQRFEVTDVTERTLGDMTDEDARREGSPDLEQYRERLRRAHDNFEWDDDSEVVRHRFERAERQ